MRLFLPWLAICLALLGCSAERPVESSSALPQLFGRSEEGFADAELRAREVSTTADGGVTIVAAALDGKAEVAIRVTLLPSWKGSTPPGFPDPLFGGKVLIESVGPRTEAFVRALAKAYRRDIGTYEGTFVTLTAISLEGDPNQVRTRPVKLKVFRDSATNADYAEAYVNLDLPRGTVQFHEKDSSYREAVIRFLTRKND